MTKHLFFELLHFGRWLKNKGFDKTDRQLVYCMIMENALDGGLV